MKASIPVVIVGAGPFGLSLAAHLRARGIEFRIFGNPMDSWRAHMPAGMMLKSEGFASDLYDPGRQFTLKKFCEQNCLPYGDLGVPVPLQTMVSYGLQFQEKVVPDVEKRMVRAMDFTATGFELRLDNEEELTAERVVIAVGHRCFAYMPHCFEGLPSEMVSHSSEHHDLRHFNGKDVTVVGAGSSAVDLAALLYDSGAQARMLVRQPSVKFVSRPRPRTLWYTVRYPLSGIGAGWKSRFFTDAPGMFRFFPQQIRSEIIKSHLGPAGPWFMQDRIAGKVEVLTHCNVKEAETKNGRIALQVLQGDHETTITTDHIIAATGYRVNAQRLSFLSDKVQSLLRTVGGAPVLSRNFESSVAGLYFVGLAAAQWFGPVMRFMFGAGYTSQRLSTHLGGVVAAAHGDRLRHLVMRPGL